MKIAMLKLPNVLLYAQVYIKLDAITAIKKRTTNGIVIVNPLIAVPDFAKNSGACHNAHMNPTSKLDCIGLDFGLKIGNKYPLHPISSANGPNTIGTINTIGSHGRSP